MRTFIRSRIRSFQHAFAGIWYVVRTQKNAWIHFTITILVIVLTAWLQLPLSNWAILILTIGVVWVVEFINTSIEAAVDLASPQRHPLAKVSKDVCAAAVLISATVSVFIGLILFGPPLWARFLILFNFAR